MGEEHPNTGSSYNNLGTVHFTEGQIEKAQDYYTKALHIYVTKLGANHPNTATIYSNLGHIYNMKKEYNQALEFYKKDLDVNMLILGNHIHTCFSHSYVSEIFYKLKQYSNAVEHCEKALKIAIDKFGLTHENTKAIEKNLETFKQYSTSTLTGTSNEQ